ncbi:WYL domain-containing protein, partial [Ectothiorhodospira haloalkaliphila]|uniref:helix-turn-helix transcriptional regulator n=1 Tax=Ectothiorhodospira haloalkaliphila TaxID=421628 RepID=UPI001EE93682
GRVEAVNPGSRPLLYRRTADACDWSDDAAIWGYALQHAFDLIAETVPKRHLDLLWERVLYGSDIQLLSRRQLRMVPDSLRLRPAELHPTVLKEVIEAMARGLALKVTYENANGDRSKPTIHPQALIQRGPIPYLFALKEDEDDLRTYALHRMIKAEHLPDTPVREADDFDLDQAIAEGKIDFGDGPPIELKIRARGYIAELLRVCPLSDDQRIFDEPDDSDFTVGIEACVLENGQLLRWLLSAGENLEVVAPDELRHTVAEQARKMAGVYAPLD